MPPETNPGTVTSGLKFCLVREDPWFRVQRRLRLIPEGGRKDGTFRRLVVFIGLGWLPLVVWALASGRVFDAEGGEPLLRHYGIHVRFLVALPALLYGERLARVRMRRLLPRFRDQGLIPAAKLPEFRRVIAGMIRLRDSTLPWVGVACVILLLFVISGSDPASDEVSWARHQGRLEFGGWWYLCVSRPIFQVVAFGWLWRVVLSLILFWRIAGIGPEPLASHPDKLGGMGFIEDFPRAFSPMVFALSSVVASKWAHEISWHGGKVSSYYLPAGVFLGLMLILTLSPLLLFVQVLRRARREALREYGELASRRGRAAHALSTEGDPAGEEHRANGSAASVYAAYDSITRMRIVPISKSTVLTIAVPVAIPMLAGATAEIPVMELVRKILEIIF